MSVTFCYLSVSCFFLQEVKEFLGEYKAKNILISKKFKHGMIFYCCLKLINVAIDCEKVIFCTESMYLA